jgi:hypothetical protein
MTRLRQGLFRLKGNTILCEDEGWSLKYSGSSWRIDCYEYRQDSRVITFGGEGATSQWDIFIPRKLQWGDGAHENLDDYAESFVLARITVALQWLGVSVGFFFIDETDPRITYRQLFSRGNTTAPSTTSN